MYRLEELEKRRLLSIALPSIPARTFSVLTFGAVANGSTNNATAIQNAINAAKTAGGGTVEFPAAAMPYESGPINLASNVNFQVDAGAELQAIPFASYPGAGSSSVSNFISAKNLSNFEITGAGTIDGNGSAWWTAFNNNSAIGRPRLINITGSNTILIQGLTLQNPAMFHIAFGATNTVTIDDITINTPSNSPNTDGIDPAGQHYLIENCSISTGDDNIAVKPQDVFCGDITVTDCFFGAGHGLSVGGETNDGLNGMTVTNCTFDDTTAGIRLKAARGEGGLVQNVSYSNLTMTDVEYPININSYYPSSVPSTPQDPAQAITSTSLTPMWQNITITNVTSSWDTTGGEFTNSYAGIIWGLPEAPVTNVTLSNVQLSAKNGMDLDHVRNLSFDSQSHITTTTGGDEITQKGGGTPFDVTVVQSNWTDSDIGSPAVAGQSVYDTDSGNWTNTAGGTGIGATDQFNLAWTNLWSDGSISTKIASQTNSNAAAEAGVMIRESTASNAAFAAVVVTPGNGVIFQWRPSDGSNFQSIAVTGKSAPLYVRVTRSGNNFTGFYSTDGMNWTQIGSAQTITMSTNAIAGIAGSANSSTATSTFVAQSTTLSPVAPVATITPISPNPIANAVPNITITFSQPITGFDVTDLALTRDGFAVPLTSATLSSSDGGLTWTLGNLSSLTANPGGYLLQLTAANSSIANSSGEGLPSGATMSWTMNTLTPTGPTRLLHDNLFVDDYLNGVYQFSFESASIPQLLINAVNNAVTIDLSAGNLNLPLAVTGGSLSLIGTSPSDLFIVDTSQIAHGSQSISIAGLQSLSLSTGTYAFDQDISGPALQVGTNASAQIFQDQHIASLAFSGNGQLNIGVQALYLAQTGPAADAAVFTLLQTAQTANWTGPGIVSILASPSDATSVGYFDNGSQIAIRYTWQGDTNLDGVINADDLSLMMLGQAEHKTDWFGGNFNYDQQIDADDWALLQKGAAFAANNILPSAAPLINTNWQSPDADLLS